MEIDSSTESTPKLLIVGASVRAAAESAQATDFQLVAADLFSDRDLLSICKTIRLESNYAGLDAWVEQVDPDYWMYTGALENYRQIVEATSARATLLGNRAPVLEQVRDPHRLAQVVQRVDCHFPETVLGSESLSPDGRWMVKPLRSAAGIGVALIDEADQVPQGHYRQRYVAGSAQSGVFLAHVGGVELLGVSKQLTGDVGFRADGFVYTGSIGPLKLDPNMRHKWQALGACLAGEFSLKGLFGIDTIATEANLTLLEVNPRYTSSVEVLERSLGRIALPLHLQACLQQPISVECLPSGRVTQMYGKAIVYAPVDLWIHPMFVEGVDRMNVDQPVVADLPHANLKVSAGSPLVTVFAVGSEIAAVYAGLRQRANEVVSLAQATSERKIHG